MAKAKKSPVVPHLKSFGMVRAFVSESASARMSVRVQLNSVEFGRLLEALREYADGQKRPLPPATLAALELVTKTFRAGGPCSDAMVLADVILGSFEVNVKQVPQKL
jgi:hypothetical protein